MIPSLIFSVIIPTKDRKDDLIVCIDALLKQSEPPLEIIVVNGGKSLADWIKSCESQNNVKIVYVKQTEGKFSRAKNIGAEMAQGDILLFIDDDVIIDRDYIKELRKVYEADTSKMIGCVRGVQIGGPELKINPLKNAYCRVFLLSYVNDRSNCTLLPFVGFSYPQKISTIREVKAMGGPIISVRKSVFKEFKFDEDFEYGEDIRFSVNISKKHRLILTPNAKFIHNATPEGGTSRHSIYTRAMNTYAHYYAFKKVVNQTPKNWILFFYSWTGYVLGFIGRCLKEPSEENRRELIGTIRGSFLIYSSLLGNDFV